jgi:hypothetical protein
MQGWSLTPYDEDQDLVHINRWLQERKKPEVDAYDIPDVGFVANFKNRPIAAGFLRQIEGQNAIFDSLVTNPNATPEFRHIGLDMVIEAIIYAAKKRGINQVLAFSVDEGTLKRALRHNFVKLPHTVISLDLKNGPSH